MMNKLFDEIQMLSDCGVNRLNAEPNLENFKSRNSILTDK